MSEPQDSTYWTRVRDLADQIGSDGCTMATGARRDCCLEHDIAYALHRTVDGVPIHTRAEADARFLACLQRHSRLGWWSPLAWVRYAAVRAGGQRAWRDCGRAHE